MRSVSPSRRPTASTGAAVGEIGQDGTHLAEAIATIVGRRAARHVGLAVGVSVSGVRMTWGTGAAFEGGPMPDGNTSFQVGSVTKVFTALLLADAVRRGEVGLEQPLETIIPDVAKHPRGRPITLLDLATHTSGLPRLPPGLRRQALRNPDDPYTAFSTDHLEAALRRPPPRPPGGRVRYSNYGFGVLGEALCRVAGAGYDALVTDRIAQPLGLSDTATRFDGPDHRRAVGHARAGKPVPDWDMGALAGAGALRSTVVDLLAFLEVHLAAAASSLAAAVELVLPARVTGGRRIEVALGWHIIEQRTAGRCWWHNGGTGGFFSFVGFAPAGDVAVVVLSNTARSVDAVGIALLERGASITR